MVLQCEKDQNWFEGDEKRISDLLVRTVKKCYQLDQENRSYDKNLDEIKVLVYRFRQYCGEWHPEFDPRNVDFVYEGK